MIKYKALKQIPSLRCSCKDARKGAIKAQNHWLCGEWGVRGKNKLTLEDLQNEKLFVEL